MPEIDGIFPIGEEKRVIEVSNAITQADNALIKYTQDLDKLIEKINKENVSFKDIIEVQKKVAKTTEDIDRVGKKLAKSEQTLIDIQDKRQKQIISNREETKKHTRELQLNDKATKALKGSYDAISASLSKNLVKYKNMSAAQREGTKAGKALEKQIIRERKELANLDQRLGNHTRNVGNYRSALAGSAKSLIGAFGVVGGITAFASVLKNSVSIISNFASAQSKLAALSGQTREQLTGLTEQAKLLGSTTQFTATQVTNLQVELVKLGYTTSEIELSTKAILNLATATGAELPDAAKTAGVALRVFSLDASRMNEVAASLAVSTTKSALTFADFDTILSNAGPVAKAYGFNLQDLIALSGKLADAGFDASKSSTALRNILLNLADSNGKLAKELGGSIDNFNDLIPALVELRKRGVSLNETLQLTDKRSVAAFNQFLNTAEGAGELRDSITGVNEELQNMVDKQLDNLAGDVTKLSSAWEGFVLKAEGGAGVFRNAVNFATDSLVKLANIDLIFKRSSKFTEDEVSRMWDVLNAINDKKAKEFRDTVAKFDIFGFDRVQELQGGFENLMEQAGFSATEAGLLWEEYIRRRKEQNDLEIQAQKDKEDKLLEQQEIAAQKRIEESEKEAEKRLKVQRKIDDELIELRKELEEENEKLREKSIENEIKNTEDLIDEYIKAEEEKNDAIKKGVEEIDEFRKNSIEKQKEDELESLKEKIEAYQQYTTIISNGFEDFVAGNKDALKEAAKSVILLALDTLQNNLRIAIAQATITSLAQPDSVLTFGATGLARAAVLTGLMEAAFGAIKGVVAGFATGTENAPGRFVAGEKGRELMMLKTGEIMMVDRPTYFEGNQFKGATIKSNPETEKIISKAQKSGNFVFDDRGLKNEMIAVRKAIEKKPVNITDNRGTIIGKQSGNHREIYLNKLRNGR